MAANRAALLAYGGQAMAVPGLLGRRSAITIPTPVSWGAADRMIPPEHGRAYASAIPGAQFRLIEHAGHLPQLETPGGLLAAVSEFTSPNEASQVQTPSVTR